MNRLIGLAAVMLCPGAVLAAGQGGHADPAAPIILGVTAILVFAVIGRRSARDYGQPSVLGELVIGIALGNLVYLLGGDFILVVREGRALFDMIDLTFAGMGLQEAAAQYFSDPILAQKIVDIVQGPYGMQLLSIAHTVDIFSRYGVIFLMFLVGLESSVEEMRHAGIPSLKVAIMGMATPFSLGLAVAWLVLPENSVGSLLFIGATLGATSVGITARVLSELNVVHSQEAGVILGAAIFDDVLGLISLAIVSGIVISGTIQGYAVLQILALSTLFIVAVMYAGPYILRTLISMMRGMQALEAKIFVTFIFVMGLAWFADLVGLATIIGAFAAGLIMNDQYFYAWQNDPEHGRASIKSLMAPLEAILVPIFFVLIGLQVKLESFLHTDVLLFASGLTLAAIVGKLVSGLVAGRNLNRLAIGIGMLPRGEVGLIFASIGKGLGVIDGQLFSAIVLMVVITTVISPSLLKWSLRRGVTESATCKTGPDSGIWNLEPGGIMKIRLLVVILMVSALAACTQETQNKFGRAIQNWTGTNGVLEIYAGDKLVRRFLEIDKLSTAVATQGSDARPYRFGYGVFDENLNMHKDPGEKKVYFEFSDYSTPYVFFEHPHR